MPKKTTQTKQAKSERSTRNNSQDESTAAAVPADQPVSNKPRKRVEIIVTVKPDNELIFQMSSDDQDKSDPPD